jgi:hypothetical protein
LEQRPEPYFDKIISNRYFEGLYNLLGFCK